MDDPIERIVADALDAAEIRYYRDGDGKADHALDFDLPDYGIAIEVKQFHSERAIRQLAGRENVILIQGRQAATGFAHMLSGLKDWQPIETAPRDQDTKPLWLASFAPGASLPRYIVQASWGVAMPGYVRCASFSGWFVHPCPVADPSRFRGGKWEHGIIFEGSGSEPTHWMWPISLPTPPKES